MISIVELGTDMKHEFGKRDRASTPGSADAVVAVVVSSVILVGALLAPMLFR